MYARTPGHDAPAGSTPYADAHGQVTALLARCARVRRELDALRAGQGQLLHLSAHLQLAHDVDRRRRAHDVTTTATLLSALVEHRQPAAPDLATAPRSEPMSSSHGCAA